MLTLADHRQGVCSMMDRFVQDPDPAIVELEVEPGDYDRMFETFCGRTGPGSVHLGHVVHSQSGIHPLRLLLADLTAVLAEHFAMSFPGYDLTRKERLRIVYKVVSDARAEYHRGLGGASTHVSPLGFMRTAM